MNGRPPVLRLSGHDAAYLRRETTAQPMHFVVYLVVAAGTDGPLTLDELRDHMRARVDSASALRRRVKWAPFGIGDPVWVTDRHFDLDRHVIAEHCTETELVTQPVDRSRPLWQLVMSPPADDGSVRLGLRCHHALADGGALRWFLEVLFGPATPPSTQVIAEPAGVTLLLDALRHALHARLRRKPVTSRAAAVQVDSVFAGPVGATRALGFGKVSVDELRRRRRQTGATINTLYLAAVTSAVRALMRRHGLALPDTGVPTLVPRDVRSETDTDAAGNHTQTMLIHLPVAVADADERLRILDNDMEAAKRRTQSAGNVGLRFDVSASNVILGRDFAVAGRRIVEAYVGAPLQGHNRLVIVCLTLDDVFSISVTTDAEWCADADVVAADIAAALNEMPVDLAAART